MSISHKSSFETIVEKGRDPLQFLANPEHTREQLDLKGLSDSARKSFATLKLWQQATGCFDHHLVQTTINKIVDQGDKCHSAIKKTLTNAQQGHTFAENVVVFCDALAQKHDTPEHLNQLLLSLIKVAEKAHRRSIKARDQLKGIHDGLSEISKDMKLQVSKIEEDALIAPDLDNDTPFNGVNTCFVTFPKSVAAVPAPTWQQPNIFPDVQDTDSDDEDAVMGGIPFSPSPWSPFSRTKHMTFTNVEGQLARIIQDISCFIEHFERCVEWWGRMKAGLDDLKEALPHIILPVARTWATSDITRGWNEVADQFSLFVFKTTPLVTDYVPSMRYPGGYGQPQFCGSSPPFVPMDRPWSPPPPITPGLIPPIIPAATPPESINMVPALPTPKSKPLWKRLCCVL